MGQDIISLEMYKHWSIEHILSCFWMWIFNVLLNFQEIAYVYIESLFMFLEWKLNKSRVICLLYWVMHQANHANDYQTDRNMTGFGNLIVVMY